MPRGLNVKSELSHSAGDRRPRGWHAYLSLKHAYYEPVHSSTFSVIVVGWHRFSVFECHLVDFVI